MDHSLSRISFNSEYSVSHLPARLNSIVPDLFFEPVSHFLRDEYLLPLFAAFRVPKGRFPIMDIHRSQFQDLAHSHTASGHQFEHETIPQLGRCKDDFIDDVFFDDFPGDDGSGPEHLPEHRAVAGAAKIGIVLALMKLKKAEKWAYLMRLVCCFLPSVIPFRNARISSVVRLSMLLSPKS